MKWIKFWLMSLLTSCASFHSHLGKTVTYSPDLFVPISWIENKSHLAMNLHYPPVEKVKMQVDANLPSPLKTRGEAHITVITPPEYEKLKTFLNMEKINALAVQHNIQQLAFHPVCLGRGRLQIDGHEESTYFMVVDSVDLLNLRKQIKEAFVLAGGALKDFDENLFFPHITVGFTKRDLHFEDGILKDKTSCWENLTETLAQGV